MDGQRYTSTEQIELITDPDEKARREAENGILQTELALEIIRNHVKDKGTTVPTPAGYPHAIA